MRDVVSKGVGADRIGNDAAPEHVVSKCRGATKIGNDAAGSMFVRVRRRALKGGHPEWRAYRQATGHLVTASASYDIVRAVRIGGKPRQKFVLGLGSIKAGLNGHHLADFWCRAIQRMRRHGLHETRRQTIISAVIRKGAPLPKPADIEQLIANGRGWGWPPAPVAEELTAALMEEAEQDGPQFQLEGAP